MKVQKIKFAVANCRIFTCLINSAVNVNINRTKEKAIVCSQVIMQKKKRLDWHLQIIISSLCRIK